MSTFLIVGRGVVGSVLASFMADAGHNPRFMGRNGFEASTYNIERYGTTERLDFPPLETVRENISGAFLATKAYDLLDAARQHLVGHLPKRTPIITLSNGAVEGVLAQLQKEAPQYRWRIGFARLGAMQLTDGTVRLVSKHPRFVWGPLLKGAASTRAEQALVASHPTFCWDVDALRLARRKWLLNLVMNSVAAAYKLPANGDLLRLEPLLCSIFCEGYRLGEEIWGYGWTGKPKSVYNELKELIVAAATNENSMARDVRLGRRTEREYLTGLVAGRSGYPLLTDFDRRLRHLEEVAR